MLHAPSVAVLSGACNAPGVEALSALVQVASLFERPTDLAQAQALTLVRGITTNAGLYCVKLCNALQGFFGNARALRGVNIKELAWVNLAQTASRVRAYKVGV